MTTTLTTEAMNLAQIIEHHGQDETLGNQTFIMFRDDETKQMQEVTYQEFYQRSLEYGNMLHQMRSESDKSIEDNFQVGAFMQNTPEFLYLLGGCAFTGSTLVGINNAQVGEKLAQDINGINLDLLVVDNVEQPKTGRTFLETVLVAKKEHGFEGLKRADIMVKGGSYMAEWGEDIETIEDTLLEYGLSLNQFTPQEFDQDKAGVIIFTSGTTGAPKGIEVSWNKLVDVGGVATKILNYTEDDVGYVCMPLNHSNSLYLNIMPALLNGAQILLRRRFSSSQFVNDISEVGATVWNCVGDPASYVVNKVGADTDHSGLPLRTVISTGTNAENRATFSKIFGLDIFTEVYGSTEVGAITMVDKNTPDYSVGKLIKDVKIFGEDSTAALPLAKVDEDGKILNFSEAVGEVVVSQESLAGSAFTGYYKQPEESAERLCNAGEEQFYRMGDLGAIVEQDGIKYLMFLGRTGTDRLRRSGENFSTTFVEDAIRKHPGVTNSAVIGIPEFNSTENDNPIYVVETKDPSTFDVDSFYQHCQETLPGYVLPGFIRVVQELPKTDTLKVRKAELSQQFIERTPAIDEDQNDRLYAVSGGVQEFETADYHTAMKKFTDPAVQSRLIAATRRDDLKFI